MRRRHPQESLGREHEATDARGDDAGSGTGDRAEEETLAQPDVVGPWRDASLGPIDVAAQAGVEDDRTARARDRDDTTTRGERDRRDVERGLVAGRAG